MVARQSDYLESLRPPKDYSGPEYWKVDPPPDPRYLWTDDHYNLLNILNFR